MRLKSLELQGFKSFPDKTVLNFESGVTAVVGPNGSGKSNITDAIRWVLGEMSTKSIRTPKMEDIIFGGSATRKPMGYAEVSLVIDNRSGAGRLDTEYDEVTVTRRYYRGGESEYMINRRAVRLKDIAELFMNTGIGKTGYSNIGQGKVAEIISQKSEDRRGVFEEAAGISKFRYQKNDAERKLKTANENKLRLSDILSELEARVGPLEKEANNAKKYLELYEQKKNVDIALWIFDSDRLRESGNENELKYSASKLSLESVDGEISEIEAKSEKLYTQIQDIKLKTDELGQKIIESGNRRHSIELENHDCESEIRHIEEQLSRNAEERAKKSKQKLDTEKQSDEQESALKKNREKYTSVLSDIASLDEKGSILNEQLKKTELLLGDTEVTQRDAEIRLVELKMNLASLNGSHTAESDRTAELEESLAEITESISSLLKQKSNKEKSLNDYKENRSAQQEKQRDAQAEIIRLEEEAEELKNKISEAKLSLDTKRQRADSLRRMDELFEGYSRSVKALMSAASNRTVKGICGPISKAITVGSDYALAIETALGANLQNIITEDEAAAKAAINYLKQTGAGRATFYPITSVKPSSSGLSENELKSNSGYVGIASRLVLCDDKYRGIIDYLLGRTAVFDNLDNASIAAKRLGYRLKIVTLDGQQINAGGSYTGGSVKHDSGMLTRKAEIERLTEQAKDAEKALIQLESSLNENREKLSDLRRISQEASENLGLLQSLISSEETQLQVILSKTEAAEKQKKELSDNLDGIGAGKKDYEKKKSDAEKEIEEAEKLISEIKDKLEKLHREYEKDDEQLDLISKEGNSLLIQKATLEKDIETGESTLASAKELIATLLSDISGLEESDLDLNKRLEATRQKIKSNSSDFEMLNSEIERIEQDRRAYVEKTMQNQKLETKLREELRDKTRAREIIFRDYTKFEAKREQLKAEHDRLASKIWDEYELTYSTACEMNLPKVDESNRQSYSQRQNELRSKIRSIGHVNVGAIDEYKEVKERYDFSKNQIEDLEKAEISLTEIIGRIEKEMQAKFLSAIDSINKNFKIVFRELFGGGDAEIYLSDPDNPLESGIEIDIAPPGKIIKSLITLSGGEQSFVAIALIFAILEVNPTPFCIFDEIESALDDVNVYRFADYMRKYSDKTQFVVITHRRGTMESADVLYGVTMPERGVSKVLGINVNEVEQKIGEKIN